MSGSQEGQGGKTVRAPLQSPPPLPLYQLNAEILKFYKLVVWNTAYKAFLISFLFKIYILIRISDWRDEDPFTEKDTLIPIMCLDFDWFGL